MKDNGNLKLSIAVEVGKAERFRDNISIISRIEWKIKYVVEGERRYQGWVQIYWIINKMQSNVIHLKKKNQKPKQKQQQQQQKRRVGGGKG